MLLNVQQLDQRRKRLKFLVPLAIGMAAILFAESAFILRTVQNPANPAAGSSVGLTHSIGTGLFTKYLLPFEVTSILLLMAIVGAMSLARRAVKLSATARVVPGAQVLSLQTLDSQALAGSVDSETAADAAHWMGVEIDADEKGDS
jgi:NADH-quinone oxidoreductase subunit J